MFISFINTNILQHYTQKQITHLKYIQTHVHIKARMHISKTSQKKEKLNKLIDSIREFIKYLKVSAKDLFQ